MKLFYLSIFLSISLGISALGFDDMQQSHLVRVFPNPTHGDVYVEGKALHQVQLFSIAGKLINVETEQQANGRLKLATHALPKGLYFVKITEKSGKEYTERLMVQAH